jgi:hypothetical protein
MTCHFFLLGFNVFNLNSKLIQVSFKPLFHQRHRLDLRVEVVEVSLPRSLFVPQLGKFIYKRFVISRSFLYVA